jgi:hypothetical protein
VPEGTRDDRGHGRNHASSDFAAEVEAVVELLTAISARWIGSASGRRMCFGFRPKQTWSFYRKPF